MFEVEIVLFECKETTETAPPNNGTSFDEKNIMANLMSDLAFQIRNSILRSRPRQKTVLHLRNYNNLITKYFDILDHSVLAEICKESQPEKQVEMNNIYLKGLDKFKKINFQFFHMDPLLWK